MITIKIVVNGQLDHQRSGWFDGLHISYSADDETVLTGVVPDEAALYKIVTHLRDLGLQITSINSEDLLDQNPP